MPEVKFKMQNSKCKIKIQNLKILSNVGIKDNYFKIIIDSALIAKDSKPGQFLNIKVNDGYEPLLRRPFSIHRVEGSSIEVLYEVVGKGTEILSRKKSGDYLNVIGPLGNGFDYGAWGMGHGSWVLVVGGIGVAPLFFLAERLMRHTTHHTRRKTTVLIGAKTEKQILCEKEFKKLGCDVKIATDDGSRGFKGYVSDLLKKILSTMDYQLSTIYACGPKPMLKEISRISKDYKIPAQVSLEEHLACGIGVCLGCAVNTIAGYKPVCKDGPVFDANEIIWQ
jgi:dihydroorotate dehydrogenase electron transfer subunit